MMKKNKPSVEHAMEQDKPVIPIRSALAILFIVLALIVAIYILSTWAGPSTAHMPRNQSFQQQNWTLSPLIKQYGITNVPVIVINCKYMRVGSFALSEGNDAERGYLGGAMCTATNSSTFCSKFSGIPLIVLNFPECKSGNKNLIYAFHSPSCPISAAQRDALNAFATEFSHDVALEYVCTPRVDQDMGLCSEQFLIGEYDQ